MGTEQERNTEHFERGRAIGGQLTAAASDPGEVFRLALNALNTAGLPMVRATGGQVALLLGIASACSEWLADTYRQTGDPELVGMVAVLAEHAEALPGGVTVVVAELSMN